MAYAVSSAIFYLLRDRYSCRSVPNTTASRMTTCHSRLPGRINVIDFDGFDFYRGKHDIGHHQHSQYRQCLKADVAVRQLRENDQHAKTIGAFVV